MGGVEGPSYLRADSSRIQSFQLVSRLWLYGADCVLRVMSKSMLLNWVAIICVVLLELGQEA